MDLVALCKYETVDEKVSFQAIYWDFVNRSTITQPKYRHNLLLNKKTLPVYRITKHPHLLTFIYTKILQLDME